MSTAELISDAEIERVHGRANFGPDMTRRDVVDQGVLTYAFGYTSGHTQMSILLEHGLIAKPNGYNSRLTKNGLRYLRSMFINVSLDEIMRLRKPHVLVECGKYRYLLRRTWDHSMPRVLYVMLNPSTADASVDDATIRSCVRLAKGSVIAFADLTKGGDANRAGASIHNPESNDITQPMKGGDANRTDSKSQEPSGTDIVSPQVSQPGALYVAERLGEIRRLHNGHCQCAVCDVPELFAVIDSLRRDLNAADARIASHEDAIASITAAAKAAKIEPGR